MEMLFKIANFFAKYSAEQWNKNRLTRRFCRSCYRALMEWPANLRRLIDQKNRLELYAQNDTYPYRDREDGDKIIRFAPWPECDDPGEYNLISDSQGFVIRRSPSYIAWKYYEATGKRLQIFPGGGHINDAKNWHKVMSLNGFQQIDGEFAKYLSQDDNQWGYYIGLSPFQGEFGQLYWYERISNGTVYLSTYDEFTYLCSAVKPGYISWYRVDKFCKISQDPEL